MTDSKSITVRHRFQHWRRTRPFWGSIVLVLGGYFIMKPVMGDLEFLVHAGPAGMSAYLLGGAMIAAAITALLTPAQRHFPAILALLAAVASLPLANLGGWIIGMALGIIGGGLVFAWTPYTVAELAERGER